MTSYTNKSKSNTTYGAFGKKQPPKLVTGSGNDSTKNYKHNYVSTISTTATNYLKSIEKKGVNSSKNVLKGNTSVNTSMNTSITGNNPTTSKDIKDLRFFTPNKDNKVNNNLGKSKVNTKPANLSISNICTPIKHESSKNYNSNSNNSSYLKTETDDNKGITSIRKALKLSSNDASHNKSILNTSATNLNSGRSISKNTYSNTKVDKTVKTISLNLNLPDKDKDSTSKKSNGFSIPSSPKVVSLIKLLKNEKQNTTNTSISNSNNTITPKKNLCCLPTSVSKNNAKAPVFHKVSLKAKVDTKPHSNVVVTNKKSGSVSNIFQNTTMKPKKK